MKEKLAKAWNWVFSSLDNHSDGMSGRKVTAMVIVGLIIQGHQHWITKENYYSIDSSDKIFVSVLLGIVTIEQIIKLFAIKNGQTVKEETTTKTTEEITKVKTTDEPKVD